MSSDGQARTKDGIVCAGPSMTDVIARRTQKSLFWRRATSFAELGEDTPPLTDGVHSPTFNCKTKFNKDDDKVSLQVTRVHMHVRNCISTRHAKRH